MWQYITLTKRIYLIDCPGIVPASAHDTQSGKVLKGVVRVEALPTPSEHIPALMERVKPIYLSRTYGVPLPDENDPTKSWDPEDFLDKLARMKGRLLKQGEPDLDGVAKIILSDWVRGRIPYFAPPPERPEELNEIEAKKAKKNLKGKGKAADAEVPGVTQNLKSIVQKNAFIQEDIRKLDVEDEEDEEDEAAQDDVEGDVEERDDSETEDVELKWADVFEGINLDSITPATANTKAGDDGMSFSKKSSATCLTGNHADSLQKEPRMKTGKVRNVTMFWYFSYIHPV